MYANIRSERIVLKVKGVSQINWKHSIRINKSEMERCAQFIANTGNAIGQPIKSDSDVILFLQSNANRYITCVLILS